MWQPIVEMWKFLGCVFSIWKACPHFKIHIHLRYETTNNDPYVKVGLATLYQGCKLHILGCGGPGCRGELPGLCSDGPRGLSSLGWLWAKEKVFRTQRFFKGGFSVARQGLPGDASWRHLSTRSLREKRFTPKEDIVKSSFRSYAKVPEMLRI